MAIRTIRKDGDPILRKQCKPQEVFDAKLASLVEDMIETMYEADGVGLAAPQIGVIKRIIVVDVYDDTGVKVLINPEIVEIRGEQCELEGCLSVPGRSGFVRRPQWVRVKGQDVTGSPVEYEGEGLLAVAFCHEIDHLNGVLFTDIMVEEGKDENRIHGNV